MSETDKIVFQGRGTYTPPQIILDVTSNLMVTLVQMSQDAGQPLDVVRTRAIGPYREALRATAEGKHIGCVASTEGLEVEFTGLATPGAQ